MRLRCVEMFWKIVDGVGGLGWFFWGVGLCKKYEKSEKKART
jgi:hypothetical protein